MVIKKDRQALSIAHGSGVGICGSKPRKERDLAGTSEPAEVGIYAVFDMLKTEPVGSRKPNSIGLYDMSGNVFEWVQDCWHESYTGAPTDGSAWLETNGGDCSLRVMRGGSWNLSSVYLQSSARNRLTAVGRVNYIGFRLAQDLD